MKKCLLWTGITLLAVLAVAGLTYHLALRTWCLHWGLTATEARAQLPGDELLPVYAGEATHAITIHAPAEKIWPWLMQIGQDRSGFYSYTFLENAIGADMPKVEHLVPDWRPRQVGETVWFANPNRFSGQGRMIAAQVQPDRTFAMVMADDWRVIQYGGTGERGLWSFNLQPMPDGGTRLIARARGGTAPTLTGKILGRLFWEPAHFVMEQKMLRTIRDLSEHS
jgi:hypothetical protein